MIMKSKTIQVRVSKSEWDWLNKEAARLRKIGDDDDDRSKVVRRAIMEYRAKH